MALIKCPDCGADVSDMAPACPKCARPIALATSVKPSPPAQRKSGVSVGFALLVLLALGAWIYYQATTSDEAPDGSASQVSSGPAQGTAAIAVPEKQAPVNQERPIFVTTPLDLYRAYSTNEVATDQSLAGKVIQFTAPVKSIDKDFTDSAVLTFSTGDTFSDLRATLKGSDKAVAAQLSPGEVVTVRCESMRRIMDSPMGDDCTFLIGSAREDSTTSSQPAASQSVAIEQPATVAGQPVEETAAPKAETADGSMRAPSGGVSPVSQEVEAKTAGPSFDCSKASESAALTICRNAVLSQLDRQMAALYQARMQVDPDQNVRDEQRSWLRDRNQCGGDVICLRQKYATRIEQLQQH